MKKWTETQKGRLIELDADTKDLDRMFETVKQRNQTFQQLEKTLVKKQKLKTTVNAVQ